MNLFPLKLYRIIGHSMEPTFHEGEYVLARKPKGKVPLSPGVVAVFRSSDDKFFIKRIVSASENEYFVKGDNPHCVFNNNPVYQEAVVGKVVYS